MVIGELLVKKMIVVLNKIDLIKPESRPTEIAKKIQQIKKVFKKTRFGSEIPVVPVAACVSADVAVGESIGIEELMTTLLANLTFPERDPTGDFCYLIDHCFALKGKGSVLTGTVISGSVDLGDEIQIVSQNAIRKVKSMQMFHKPVESAQQGDRLGLLVTALETKNVERGVACTPGYLRPISRLIMSIQKIRYFKFPIKSKTKYHISSGHSNTQGTVTIFSILRADVDSYNTERTDVAEIAKVTEPEETKDEIAIPSP